MPGLNFKNLQVRREAFLPTVLIILCLYVAPEGVCGGQSRKTGQQIARRNSKSSLNSAYEEALSELPSPKQDLFFNQKILDLIANMFKDSKLKPKNHGYIQLDCSAYDVNGACTREWSSDCYQPTGTTDTYNGECSVCSYGRTTETKYLWVKRNYCSP